MSFSKKVWIARHETVLNNSSQMEEDLICSDDEAQQKKQHDVTDVKSFHIASWSMWFLQGTTEEAH